MADERDLELLDDYLTNRMREQDRSAFEQKLKADPDLQHEYALQQRLIQGIKDVRVAELKSMLNNVAVPAGNTGTLASKIIAGTVVSLIIVTAAYLYFRSNPQENARHEPVPAPQQVVPEVSPQLDIKKQESTATPERQTTETDKNQTSAGTEHSKPSLAKKPTPLAAPGDKNDEKSEADGPVLDVFTPDKEESSIDADAETLKEPTLKAGTSSLVVETDRNNRRYTFHYQFRDGKLFLYGPFEKNLYEIMEFFAGDKRTVFLFYKDQYYLLPEADNKIKSLTPIADPALIKKLKEYRDTK